MKLNIGRYFLMSGTAAGCLLIIYSMTTFSPKKNHSLNPEHLYEKHLNRTKVLAQLQTFLTVLNKENVSSSLKIQFKEILKVVQYGEHSANLKTGTSSLSNENAKEKAVEPREVCPEKWEGSADRPYFYSGWKIQNCSDALPFHTVLSILIYPSSKDVLDCANHVRNVIAGLKERYSEVPVIVANVNNFCKNANVSSQIRIVDISESSVPPGRVWNALVQFSTTRYVLLGRQLDNFMWQPNLERPVHVISYSNNTVEIAGGSVRNRTGHWRIGCHQSSLKNYILEYQTGYLKSKNECMYCDLVTGPFVGRRNLLRDLKFDESLPEEVLFEDFFLTLKQESQTVVNCPDVMYFASDPLLEQKAVNRLLWLPLAHKLGLNRIAVPDGLFFSYSCLESGLSCSDIYSLTESYLIPICCLEQFATAVAFLDDFCRAHNIPYEFEAGSVLGIVKVAGLMPWDLDGDCTFFTGNLSIFEKHIQYFKGYHMDLNGFALDDRGSYFKLRTPDMYIEMIGEPKMSYEYPRFEEFRSVPTQALMFGRWVFVQSSPGLYSRNRYGVEMLRHTHSYSQLGKDGWAPYKSGYFRKCRNPKHHACLDHFSTDGNMQFYTPNAIHIDDRK